MQQGRPTLVIGNRNYSSWSLRPWLLMKQLGIDLSRGAYRKAQNG